MGNRESLSGTEYLIMKLLMEAGSEERYGLQLIEKSGNKLKRGTIYVLLGRLQDKGYVTSRVEASDSGGSAIPRRMYRTTGVGREVFRAWSQIAEIGGLRGVPA